MPPLYTWINNFVQDNNSQRNGKNRIDIVSKLFIIAELTLGLNRLHVVGIKKIYNVILICYYYTFITVAVLFIITKSYYIIYISENILEYLVFIDFFQFIILTTANIIFFRTIHEFYTMLNKLDDEMGFIMKISKDSVYNVTQLIMTFMLSVIFFCIPTDVIKLYPSQIPFMIMTVLHALELHFHGHLFSLITPRLRLLKTYLKLSISHNHSRTDIDSDEELINYRTEYSHMNLQRLLHFYNKLIIIYDCLNDAIKWQMLTLLIQSFFVTLSMSFFLSKEVIVGRYTTGIYYWDISYLIIELLPIFSPCIFADRVSGEVRQIREILSSRLYEKTLDKSNRGTARALLAMTKTRDLSFSLFHMFDIDITLPFKFMALELTYLIILLQFDKVFNP